MSFSSRPQSVRHIICMRRVTDNLKLSSLSPADCMHFFVPPRLWLDEKDIYVLLKVIEKKKFYTNFHRSVHHQWRQQQQQLRLLNQSTSKPCNEDGYSCQAKYCLRIFHDIHYYHSIECQSALWWLRMFLTDIFNYNSMHSALEIVLYSICLHFCNENEWTTQE